MIPVGSDTNLGLDIKLYIRGNLTAFGEHVFNGRDE